MSRKIGISKTPPKSEARPLGTPKPKNVNRADAARLKIVERAKKENAVLSVATEAQITETHIPRETFEELDARVKQEMHEEHVEHAPTISEDNALHVASVVVDSISEVAAIQPTESAAEQQEHHMTLTFVKNSRNGKRAIYSGAANSLVFPLTAFPSKQAPSVIIVEGDVFATKAPAETKAERKARLAALPKPTLAERIAKREAQLAKDKAKLAAQSAGMQHLRPQGSSTRCIPAAVARRIDNQPVRRA